MAEELAEATMPVRLSCSDALSLLFSLPVEEAGVKLETHSSVWPLLLPLSIFVPGSLFFLKQVFEL